MSIYPFIIAVVILVVIAFVATFLIGLKPTEGRQLSFKQRSRNLLLIYGCITSMLVIALAVFLYNV
ncbi:hypothetical protein [Brevibacillus parabrevis]|uniref:hypothetical protein n=1 Tax=Brevibacillus parabrevis TaxID=54914 RepID=UPI0028D1286B|nr:hypothetical protein [Brevibacillus parabrevis]MED1723478.1 hypothetical protein [Brevibacillus parabrevis]